MSVIRKGPKDPETGRGTGPWLIDIVYEHPDGSRQRVRKVSPVQTKRGALRFEREIRNALADGTYGRKEEPPEEEPPTLKEFAPEFIEGYARMYNRPSEVTSKEAILRRYLLPRLGKLRLDEIRVRQIERLKSWMLAGGKSPKTVNNATGVLGKLLRWAHEIEVIGSVPRIRKLKVAPPTWDFFDFDEADRLLEAARYNPEWYAMIYFDLKTGLRFGELSELRNGDLDLEVGRVMVRRSYYKGHVHPPKNGKPREIPLSSSTIAFMKQRRHLRSDLVFCKEDGGRHIHRRADAALRRCCRYAGLREIGWHGLRHTFASHLVMSGASLKSVQELLGHSTMEMTLRYAHLSPKVRREAVELLDKRPSHGTIATLFGTDAI